LAILLCLLSRCPGFHCQPSVRKNHAKKVTMSCLAVFIWDTFLSYHMISRLAPFEIPFLDFRLLSIHSTQMNTTCANPSTDWSPADITGMVNVGLIFLCIVINLHQSYNHKHYKSSCCNETCFDVIIERNESTLPKK
jgi:hypothetical protein